MSYIPTALVYEFSPEMRAQFEYIQVDNDRATGTFLTFVDALGYRPRELGRRIVRFVSKNRLEDGQAAPRAWIDREYDTARPPNLKYRTLMVNLPPRDIEEIIQRVAARIRRESEERGELSDIGYRPRLALMAREASLPEIIQQLDEALKIALGIGALAVVRGVETDSSEMAANGQLAWVNTPGVPPLLGVTRMRFVNDQYAVAYDATGPEL